MYAQFYQIKIKKECVDIEQIRIPSFHLWAENKIQLNEILESKKISKMQIQSITEKGDCWDIICGK